MNLFDQTPLTVYLVVVLGLAVVGTAAALVFVADAAVHTWRSKKPRPARPQRQRDRIASGRATT